MTDSIIGVDEPSTIDKKIDTEQLIVGANTVERERVQIAGATATAIAPVDATLGLSTNPTDRALRDMGKVDIAAFDAALPVGTNNIGDVDVLTLPVLPAGDNNIGNVDIVTMPNPAQNLGKTISRFVLAQGAAGTTEIAAASPGNKHKLIKAVFTMSADGTAKFSDGVGDLTGAMDVAAKGGFVIPSDTNQPWLETATNSPLNIVTTVGLAKGLIVFVTEA